MKTRNGFVSNSSSSSFIIGIANVKEKAGNLYFDGDFTSIPYYIKYKPINDEEFELTIESFSGREVSCIAKVGDNIIYLNSDGPDGD